MKKYIIIILSAIICVALVVGCFNWFEEDNSNCGTIMVTTVKEGSYTTDYDIAASNSLLSTVGDLLLSADAVYRQLSDQLDRKYSAVELKRLVSITRDDDNCLHWNIKFKIDDAEMRKKVTNAFLELVPEYIRTFIPMSHTVIVKRVE